VPAGGVPLSAVSVAASVTDKSTAESATGISCGFETIIMWVHTRHLNLAAAPLILEGSIRYFFPHSSQMTIMAELLYYKF
jgi:hypothetical protein